MVPARMRIGVRWTDATILNISSRGLMVCAQAGAEPGSYIELRRDDQVIVARVIWRRNRRIGLSAQERLSVDQLVSGKTAAAPAITGEGWVERRARPRDHEQSRLCGRMIDGVAVAVIAVALAGLAAGLAQKTIAKPLKAVEATLDEH